MRFRLPPPKSTVSALLIGLCSLTLSLLFSLLLESAAVGSSAQLMAIAPTATNKQAVPATTERASYGMVDPIDDAFATGYSVYLEHCARCHVALPPAVLPIETWQNLVSDVAHYGVTLPVLSRFDQQLMLNYLQTYARRNPTGTATPYRLQNSTYFKALHPNVELPQPLNLQSCTSCHQGATTQDYRQ